MGKKNIDQLFQEKFKDFAEQPNEKVWQAIEASLDAKRSRRLLPIWWTFGGVAAALILGLFLINSFDDAPNTPSRVVNTPNATDTISIDKNNVIEKEQPLTNSSSKPEQIATKNATEAHETKSTFETVSTKSNANVTPFKNRTNTEEQTLTKNTSDHALTATDVQNSNQKEEVSSAETDQKHLLNTHAPHQHKGIAAIDSTATVLKPQQNQETLTAIEEKNTTPDAENSNKTSIYEAIATQENEEALTEKKANKWSAGPSIAPVYFNTLGEGSPIHPAYATNNKSGDINLSYGLSVAYKINKKISVRSGIHKVDYAYATNDIAFSSSLNPSSGLAITTIDFASSSENLVLGNARNTGIASFDQSPVSDNSDELVNAFTASSSGAIDQQFGYLEVPLELNYSLIDQRFGLQLIGGFSSLFLIDNSVSLRSGDLTTAVGKANNINSVNFSTNIGFGVAYTFSQKLKFNIAPMFKYQWNTFSNTEGNFQPFSIGVYSGLNFRF